MFGDPGSVCFPDSRDIAIKRLGLQISKPARRAEPNCAVPDSGPMALITPEQIVAD